MDLFRVDKERYSGFAKNAFGNRKLRQKTVKQRFDRALLYNMPLQS